jgi:hypothetical protein
MESNIYDLLISELVLRVNDSGVSYSSPKLVMSNSLNSNNVQENFSGSVAWTSEIINIPVGYTVKANSHVITYPTAAPAVIGSSEELIGSPIATILGAVGSTFIVTSTITLEKSGDPDIILNSSNTLTSVLPLYFGVKAYSGTPTVTSLTGQAVTNLQFTLTSTILGRLYVVLPVSSPAVLSVTGPSGLIYPATDFELITSGSFNYYILKWDTIFTGTNIKNFTINFI